MVLRPKLFLLDEPFSGLDAPLRASTRSDLAELKRSIHATMVLVTHDQAEALALGDRVAVIDQGRVVQVGRPLDVYDRPNSRFVARFIGQPPMNLLPCRVDRDGAGFSIRIDGLDGLGPWPVAAKSLPARVEAGFRPEQLQVGPVDAAIDRGLPATVHRLEPLGHETLAYLTFGPHSLVARLAPTTAFQPGERVLVGLDFSRACWFDGESGVRSED
jgi:ABC-type sugar transport system ATPase subunit